MWRAERERKIFKRVRSEARAKRAKAALMAERQKAEEDIGSARTRVKVRIAGLFGEKRLLVKLQDLIKDRPYDVVNLQLHVPTLQGLSQNTPAYMDFEVTSTKQEDVTLFVKELRTLVNENDLVWVD